MHGGLDASSSVATGGRITGARLDQHRRQRNQAHARALREDLTHPITATYSGSITFGGSASAVLNQVITP